MNHDIERIAAEVIDHLKAAEARLRWCAAEAGMGAEGRDWSATATQVAAARQRARGVLVEHAD